MEAQGSDPKRKIIVAVLLLLLAASAAALGITLISRNRQAHPTVEIPESTLQTEPAAPSEEPTAPSEAPDASTEPAAESGTTDPTGQTRPAGKNSAAKKKSPSTTTPTKANSSAGSAGTTQKATLLQLHKRRSGDNVPFYTANLFPGDQVSRSYCVRVAHSHSVTLRFRADVREGCETLAQVLKCTVKQGNTVLYDGLMAEMPQSLDIRLETARRITRDVVYEITAYLDTSVGNAYQDQELWADFRWWIEEKDALEDLPRTGDDVRLILFSVIAAVSLLGLLALLALLSRKDRRLARLLGTLILLALLVSALTVSAYAAVWLQVDVKNNFFHTGTVKINLNDGSPVTQDGMFRRFEPGMTVNAPLFLQNESTGPVYYKLYLKDVEGDLADVLEMSILDGTEILYTGSVTGCTRLGVGRADRILNRDERKQLTVSFYFPREAGNEYQDKELSFVLCADAVQTKNNPNGVFE